MSTRTGFFIVARHTKKPAPGERTNQKDWGETARWEVIERVDFVGKITDKLLVEASTILDVENTKILKNKFKKASYRELMDHFGEQYPEQMKKFYQLLAQYRLEKKN